MSSRNEEEDQKVSGISKTSGEEEEILTSPKVNEHIEYLMDSLRTADQIQLQTLLTSLTELLSSPALVPYRKSIVKFGSSFANSLMKLKTDKPFFMFIQMLQNVEASVNKSLVAYRLIKFATNVAADIKLLQKVIDEDVKEDVKIEKQAAIEARKERKKIKEEEATAFISVITKLMMKIDSIDERTLEKIKPGIANIGRKADFSIDSKELQGDSKESLVKILDRKRVV